MGFEMILDYGYDTKLPPPLFMVHMCFLTAAFNRPLLLDEPSMGASTLLSSQVPNHIPRG